MNTWRTAKHQYDCLSELGPWMNYGLIVVANMRFMVAFLVQLAQQASRKVLSLAYGPHSSPFILRTHRRHILEKPNRDGEACRIQSRQW